MNTGVTVAAAVASGYLLGRTKKLKLAVAAGGLLMGKRLASDPRQLVKQGVQYLQSSPELSRLTEQVRGTLLDAARSAAVSTASDRLESLTDALHERTERWLGEAAGEEAEPEEEAEQPEEPEEAEEAEEGEEGETPEEEAEEEPAAEQPRRRSSTAKSTQKAPAKKSASTGKKAAEKTARQTSGTKRTGGTAKKGTSSRARSTQ